MQNIAKHLVVAESHGEVLDFDHGWIGNIASDGFGWGWHGDSGWIGPRDERTQSSLRGPSGWTISWRLSSPIPRNRSSTRISMKECTKALVATLPTPSAPGSQLNPRWQLTSAIAAPKKKVLKIPMRKSNASTYSREFVQ